MEWQTTTRLFFSLFLLRRKSTKIISLLSRRKNLTLFCESQFPTVCQATRLWTWWFVGTFGWKETCELLPSSVIALHKVTPNHNTQRLSGEQQGLRTVIPLPIYYIAQLHLHIAFTVYLCLHAAWNTVQGQNLNKIYRSSRKHFKQSKEQKLLHTSHHWVHLSPMFCYMVLQKWK